MFGNQSGRSDGFLSPRYRPSPSGNQAESPPPSHSSVGQRFRAWLVGRSDSKDTPQTARHPERGHQDWRGDVIRSQTPLYLAPQYMDLIGVFLARPAKTVTVMSAFRYSGQLPMSQQPKLQREDPWSDPVQGRP